MPSLIPPHGGRGLRPLQPQPEECAQERRRARSLPRLRVSSREKGDLLMLGIGGFTPLEGFMTRADWLGVCGEMRTGEGVFWPIPITLSTDTAAAASIAHGAEVALADPDDGSVLAVMKVAEQYRIDKTHECVSVFGTADPAHPRAIMPATAVGK